MSVKKDQWIGLAAILFGGYVIWSGLGFGTSQFQGDPGSGTFPILAGTIAVLCGILLVITARKTKNKPFMTKAQYMRLFSMLAVYAALWLGLKYLGYIITAPVIIFTICTLMAKGQKVPVWHRVIYALAVSGSAYFLFQHVLSIRLPAGVFF